MRLLNTTKEAYKTDGDTLPVYISKNRKKEREMNFELFSGLYKEALESTDKDMFIGERGWQYWMNDYEVKEVAALLSDIYTLANSGIRENRERYGFTRAAFCRRHDIPKRTAESWEMEQNKIAPYLKELLDYSLLNEEKEVDLTLPGKIFGRLIAVSPDKGNNWRCLCDCGNICFVDVDDLKNGFVKSCGCEDHLTRQLKELSAIKKLEENKMLKEELQEVLDFIEQDFGALLNDSEINESQVAEFEENGKIKFECYHDKNKYAIVSKDEIELDGFKDHYLTGKFEVYYFESN